MAAVMAAVMAAAASLPRGAEQRAQQARDRQSCDQRAEELPGGQRHDTGPKSGMIQCKQAYGKGGEDIHLVGGEDESKEQDARIDTTQNRRHKQQREVCDGRRHGNATEATGLATPSKASQQHLHARQGDVTS